jgi:hypothetical protein
MLPPNSTIRRVDVFSSTHDSTLCDCYATVINEVGGESNRYMTASYIRAGGFLDTIRYFKSHGYGIVKGTFRANSGLPSGKPYVRLERETFNAPIPF